VFPSTPRAPLCFYSTKSPSTLTNALSFASDAIDCVFRFATVSLFPPLSVFASFRHVPCRGFLSGRDDANQWGEQRASNFAKAGSYQSFEQDKTVADTDWSMNGSPHPFPMVLSYLFLFLLPILLFLLPPCTFRKFIPTFPSPRARASLPIDFFVDLFKGPRISNAFPVSLSLYSLGEILLGSPSSPLFFFAFPPNPSS